MVGRYALFDELASGGMATVHLGRLLGPIGFGRTVAIKRMHEHYLKDDEFITMFMDEARIVARIRHPNVVPMVDVVQSEKGLFLVMEYVHGETLSRLMRTSRKQRVPIPPRIVAAIVYGLLLGLHGAHDTKGPDGKLLGVVHRDVSPQNVMIGSDGNPRVLDFGIAKAAGRAQVTREGQIKGKLAYMAPEQIRGQVDRRTDVFAAAVVLWEALAGRRMHDGLKDVEIVTRVVKGNFPKPSQFAPNIPPELDEIVLKGLEVKPERRYSSARDMAIDLERRVGLASPNEVADWVEHLAHDVLAARSAIVNAMETAAAELVADTNVPPASFAQVAPLAPPAQSGSQPAVPAAPPINVEVEAPPPNEANTSTSTSSVFAHTQTPHPQQLVYVAPPTNMKPVIAMVSACLFLAVIGIALGAYAIVHKPSHTTAGSPSASASTSSVLAPELPPATAPSLPTAPSATSEEINEAPPPAPSGAAADPPPPGTGTPTPVVGQTPPTPKVGPTPAVGAPAGAKPSGKKCDPPYTTDEKGQRKYKPECLGLD